MAWEPVGGQQGPHGSSCKQRTALSQMLMGVLPATATGEAPVLEGFQTCQRLACLRILLNTQRPWMRHPSSSSTH